MIPESIKSNIIEIQQHLKTLPIEAKYIESENLHLSLSFLGEIDDIEVKRISDILDLICSNCKKFEIAVSRINLIPNENYVRVIVLDVEKELTLDKIAKGVKEGIGGDIKPPHITLCRVKNIDKKISIPQIKKIEINFKFKVSSVSLVKSVLQKTGPFYQVIHEGKLSEI
jgi:2'-5' RNA ligase